ncbi:hypothetical protein GCM10007863_11250 [Dyella mobilis]|nr:hypothetical protein GCM10007863_11250 [Dyella mobilis]
MRAVVSTPPCTRSSDTTIGEIGCAVVSAQPVTQANDVTSFVTPCRDAERGAEAAYEPIGLQS